ncbi:hypothetical protein M5689_008684 [Euphorbia peplus]|nr:hypothetical protein M5689_008684 [Euphorbia peplus]
MMSYVAIFFFVLHAIPSQLEAGTDPISVYCRKSIHEEECKAVVESSPMKDKKGICTHALGVAMTTVSEMGKKFESMKDPKYQKPIQECTTIYTEATKLVQKSQDAVKEEKYNHVNQWISSAMSSASSCEYKFKDAKVTSPVTDLNKKFNKYLSVVITISNLP